VFDNQWNLVALHFAGILIRQAGAKLRNRGVKMTEIVKWLDRVL